VTRDLLGCTTLGGSSWLTDIPERRGTLKSDPPHRVAITRENLVQLRSRVRRAGVDELDLRGESFLAASGDELERPPSGRDAVGRGARGLARGSIYTQDGRLVVSTAQEGLIRRRPLAPT